MPRISAGPLDNTTGPNPIDVYVGSRIRLRRNLCFLSQQHLGDALGLTFQQIQKYERGTNRVCASRLFEISRVLSVNINYFFDEMPESLSGSAHAQEPQKPVGENHFAERETSELVRAFYRISDRGVRRRMIGLIKSLTG